MPHVKDITLALICICIMQHFLQANAHMRKAEKEGKRRGRQKQHSLSSKPVMPSHDQNTKGSTGSIKKGRFSNNDGSRCTWAASSGDTEDDGTFVLGISCLKGSESFECEYRAKPRLCPEYASSANAYWKQIARSLKKQKKLCHDPKARIKAGLCRKAPREAHFKLKTAQKVHPASGRRNKQCKNLDNRKKMADEYCSSSWTSLCTFFFAMIESEDC